MGNKEIMLRIYNKDKYHEYFRPVPIKIRSFSIIFRVTYHQFSHFFLMLRGCDMWRSSSRSPPKPNISGESVPLPVYKVGPKSIQPPQY